AAAAPDVLANDRAASAPVFLVSYGRTARNGALEALAHESGGEYLPAASPRKILDAFSRIGRRLGAQYTLGYEPDGPPRPGQWRSIHVALRRPSLTVFARQGWMDPPPAGRPPSERIEGARGPGCLARDRRSGAPGAPEDSDGTRPGPHG